LTLVELLVALAILVSVTGSTLLVFRGVTRAWRTGELRSARYQLARLLSDLFSREMASCVSNPSYPLIGLPRGEDSPLHAGETLHDEVMFVAALAGRSGLIERGYWVNADGDLMCHDQDAADGNYQTGFSERCAREIQSFAVSYFDGAAWLTRWDAHPLGQLPKAVRIELGLGRDKPERFETVIHVPSS
jgi:hypothetical protein